MPPPSSHHWHRVSLYRPGNPGTGFVGQIQTQSLPGIKGMRHRHPALLKSFMSKPSSKCWSWLFSKEIPLAIYLMCSRVEAFFDLQIGEFCWRIEDSKLQRQLELNNEVYWKSNCTKLLRTPWGEGEMGLGGMTAASRPGKGREGCATSLRFQFLALVSSC